MKIPLYGGVENLEGHPFHRIRMDGIITPEVLQSFWLEEVLNQVFRMAQQMKLEVLRLMIEYICMTCMQPFCMLSVWIMKG